MFCGVAWLFGSQSAATLFLEGCGDNITLHYVLGLHVGAFLQAMLYRSSSALWRCSVDIPQSEIIRRLHGNRVLFSLSILPFHSSLPPHYSVLLLLLCY